MASGSNTFSIFGEDMGEAVVALPTLSELSTFVHRTLCQQDSLDPEQAPLVRVPLTRTGRPCGFVFHVEGPRLLRTSAVWAADDHRIIFYDSTGLRVRSVRLSESPDSDELQTTRLGLAS
jgi:hypothetical protein